VLSAYHQVGGGHHGWGDQAHQQDRRLGRRRWQVFDVANLLRDHPGGELAIWTCAGKDATEEFNTIHPPDVI
jgi:hypothetical protein